MPELRWGDRGADQRARVLLPIPVTLDGCSQPRAPKLPFTTRLTLLLGRIWAKVDSGEHRLQISTEGSNLGNRGTIFWVSYRRTGKVTTLYVARGSVWMRAAGRTITITAGHLATQRNRRPAVVRRAPIDTRPSFG